MIQSRVPPQMGNHKYWEWLDSLEYKLSSPTPHRCSQSSLGYYHQQKSPQVFTQPGCWLSDIIGDPGSEKQNNLVTKFEFGINTGGTASIISEWTTGWNSPGWFGKLERLKKKDARLPKLKIPSGEAIPSKTAWEKCWKKTEFLYLYLDDCQSKIGN